MKSLSIVITLALFWACFGVSATEKIDINTAPLNDLIKIVHIGEKRGLELISLRPFSSLEDLTRIKGIGLVRVEDIKKQGLAYVEPSTEKILGSPEPAKPTKKLGTEAETIPLVAGSETLPDAKTNEPLKIDINIASAQELQALAGVGVVLAQRIIEIRPFYTLDDLTKVNGIGAETLKDIKSQGLAWINPNLAPPKTEEIKTSDKKSVAVAAISQQDGNRNLPTPLFIFLLALTLAIFSGIIILILKRNLRTFSP